MRIPRWPVLLRGAGIAAVLAATTLWLVSSKATLTRDEALRAALNAPGNEQLPISRVTAVKLIHRYEIATIIGQDGATDTKPWDRVWVVVLKGAIITPSMPGGPTATYTITLIRDRKPAVVELYDANGPGDLPANWDQLIDLQ
jgi:hypothetical protein